MDSSDLKVLILGHEGMLGWVAKKYFWQQNCIIETISSRWPTQEFKKKVCLSKSDFVLNCIGAIPQKFPKDYSINEDLPEYLCNNFQGKIVHPASNIEEFPNSDDSYAISKKRGSWFVKNIRPESLIVSSSTIGPSLDGIFGVWDTIEKSNDTVYGYTNHFWNGVTTLEWTNYVYGLIMRGETGHRKIYSEKLSKYQLMKILAEKLEKQVTIIPKEQIQEKDFCISQGFETKPIDQQINDFISWRKIFTQ